MPVVQRHLRLATDSSWVGRGLVGRAMKLSKGRLVAGWQARGSNLPLRDWSEPPRGTGPGRQRLNPAGEQSAP